LTFLSSTESFSLDGETARYCLSLGVPPAVLEAVGVLEGGKRPYPYLIRVNGSFRVRVPKAVAREISPNVFDCRQESICRALALALITRGVKNLDLGYYQINYLHAPANGIDRKELLEKAFNLKEEGKLACRILADRLKRYGYNANAVATYHSLTPERNYAYAVRFYRVYRKILKRKKN